MKKLLVCLAFCLSLPATAETRKETLDRVGAYLNSITTIESGFSQIAPDGSESTGKFYLARPGKMRWQYNPPVPVVMISNGSSLNYIDTELQQVTSIPLDRSLAGFLAQPKIDFDRKAIRILGLESGEGMIRLSITQAAHPDEGELTMEFTDQPVTLRNLRIKDAGGQVTNVALTGAEFGKKVDPELFVFKDPRLQRR